MLEQYWDSRFGEEGRIWGDYPSKTAKYALQIFERNHVKTILIPGAGYGRNSKLFSSHGFKTCGVEISKAALAQAGIFDPETKFFQGSVIDIPYEPISYDAIYCFNVLHLFREGERNIFIDRCFSCVKEGGILFFTVFSDQEQSFGRGTEAEKNTFESKPGRPVHYFTAEDLNEHFQKGILIETGIMEDEESHGSEGPHTHILRYICIRKVG